MVDHLNMHLNQTGRTTRQMQQALDLSRKGYRVFYMVMERSSVHWARARLSKLVKGETHYVEVQALNDHRDFDFMTMRPFNEPITKRIWIVDHDAIEQEIKRLAERSTDIQLLMLQLYPLTRGDPIAIDRCLVPDGGLPSSDEYMMPGRTIK